MIDIVPNSIKSQIQNSALNDIYDYISIEEVRIHTNQDILNISGPRRSHQIKRIKQHGQYEPVLTNEIYECLDSKSVFFDVGSYFGYYTQIASAAGVDSDNIYAFEANPLRCKILSKCNDDIHIVNSQVGSNNSELSIDSFANRQETSPDIIKIDVDGYEYDVVKGIESILTNTNIRVYVEIHPFYLDKIGKSSKDILDLVEDFNCELVVANHTVNTDWVSPEEFQFDNFEKKRGAHHTFLARID